MLFTPFSQEEFNPTDDRKSKDPRLGVTCFDCHVSGHTTGQFHLRTFGRRNAAPALIPRACAAFSISRFDRAPGQEQSGAE
jgi:hypothetical protein